MEDIIAAKSTTRELVVRRGKNVVHRGEGSGGGIVRHKHRRGQEIVRRGEDLVAAKKSSVAAKTSSRPRNRVSRRRPRRDEEIVHRGEDTVSPGRLAAFSNLAVLVSQKGI